MKILKPLQIGILCFFLSCTSAFAQFNYNNTTASGADAVAGGEKSMATGTASTALNYFTKANGNFSLAAGNASIASGTASTALNYLTKATADYSFAAGKKAAANAIASTALNHYTRADGNYSLAAGDASIASGIASTALGKTTTASGNFSFATGELSRALNKTAIAMGYIAHATANGSVAIGSFLEAGTDNAFVLGSGDLNSGAFFSNNIPHSMMIGFNSDLPTLFVGAAAGAGTTGNVGIGVINPNHKLEVCGTIRSKEVIVETGWCDYVFEEDYELMPLEEVDAFIQENKHLPGIPAGEIVETEGLKVAEMQANHMKKIEELTLYLIELKKDHDALKSRLEELEN